MIRCVLRLPVILYALNGICQSINVIESPQLRALFLMLRDELKDEDIPHRTTVRNRILEVWDEHLDHLAEEMNVCPRPIHLLGIQVYLIVMQESLGKVSFTTDMWSDPNKTP